MKGKILFNLLLFLFAVVPAEARVADPYPIAFLRQGDIYLIEGRDSIRRLTELGDVREICWLDGETICFSREMDTGLAESENWTGYSKIRDLFLVKPDNGEVRQFTADHFTRAPAPSTMPGRALYWRDNRALGTISEIWETIQPLRRNRPLGIRGINPDSAPNQRWTAAQLGDGDPEGIGLYRYPTNDSYRKLRGPYYRPRFSPDSRLLTYINLESGRPEIWGYEIPDGDPHRLLGVGERIRRIVDFGWAKDASGYILVLEDTDGNSDVYYWEIEPERLTRLTRTGDVISATSWH